MPTSSYLKNKAFEMPPVNLSIEEALRKDITPADIIEFTRDVCKSNQRIGSDISIHLSTDSPIKLEMMIASFGLIIDKWESLEEDKKARIAFRLAEGAKECTDGFITRLNDIINLWLSDFTLLHYLQVMRNNLIASSTVGITDDIHNYNRFFLVAARNGYGVRGNDDDPYGSIGDSVILSSILLAMEDHYHPVAILNSVLDRIKEKLSQDAGYKGCREEGQSYSCEEYTEWFNLIEQFFGHGKISLHDALLFDDDDYVQDINWPYLNHYVFQQLREQIFDLSENISQALDYLLSPEADNLSEPLDVLFIPVNQKEQFIKNIETVFTLLDLIPLERKKMELWNRCYSLIYEQNQIDELIFYIAKHVPESQQKALFTAEFTLMAVKSLAKNKNQDGLKILLNALAVDAALQIKLLTQFLNKQNENSLKTILFLLSDNQLIEKSPSLEKRLRFEFNNHWQNRFGTVEQVKQALSPGHKQHQTLIDMIPFMEETKLDALLKEPDINFFIKVISAKPELLLPLLNMIDKYSPEEKAILLKQVNEKNRSNALILAAAHQPQAIELLLEMISEFDLDTQCDLMTQTDAYGDNACMKAIMNSPVSTTILFNDIKSLPSEVQISIFKQSNKNGYNVLLLAIERQHNLGDLMKFIKEMPQAERIQILQQTTKKGWGALALAAAGNHPEIRDSLIDIHQIDNDINEEIRLLKQSMKAIHSMQDWSRFSIDIALPVIHLEFIRNDRKNYRLVWKAVWFNGEYLKYADVSLQMNLDILLVALEQTPKAVQYVPQSIQANVPFITAIAGIARADERHKAIEAYLSTEDYQKDRLICRLTAYHYQREQESSALRKPRRFLSLFSNQQPYEKNIKLLAARKLIQFLNGDEVTFEPGEKKAIKDGRLKAIFKDNPEYLPSDLNSKAVLP